MRAARFRTPWARLIADGLDALETKPTVIEFRSEIRLDRPIRLSRRWEVQIDPGRREGAVLDFHGLVLRGRRGATRPHIISVMDGFRYVYNMIVMEGGEVRLEGLWLDVGAGALNHVLIVSRSRRVALHVVDSIFSGLAAWTVYMPFMDGGDRVRLDFEGCDFRCSSDGDRPSIAAVVVGEGDIAIRDSTFSGRALAMVWMASGRLSLDSCSFANRYVPDVTFAAGGFFSPFGEALPVPQTGYDVYIERVLYAPVSIVASNCVSRSSQFLFMAVSTVYDLDANTTYEGPELDAVGQVCAVLLMNLHHQPAFVDFSTTGGGLHHLPPAIYWGADSPTAFALTIVGSSLNPSPFLDRSRLPQAAKVAVRTGGDQRIYDAWLLPPGPRYEVWNSTAPCNIVTLAPRTVSTP